MASLSRFATEVLFIILYIEREIHIYIHICISEMTRRLIAELASLARFATEVVLYIDINIWKSINTGLTLASLVRFATEVRHNIIDIAIDTYVYIRIYIHMA